MFYAGQFVLDLGEFYSAIKDEFARYKKQDGFIVIIFCPQGNKYSKFIFESFSFWNRYSDQYVTILLPGYVGNLSCPDEEFSEITKPDFKYSGFKEVLDRFEETTSWKYSGGCDILGFRVRVEKNSIAWDYKRGIAFNIEAIDHDKKFDLNMYITGLVNKAKTTFEHDPIDKIENSSALDAFKTILLTILPEKVGALAERYAQIDLKRPRDLAPRE